MSKLLAWFATENGRNLSGFLSLSTITTFTLASWLPNSLLLENYCQVVQLYKNGTAVAVPEEVECLVEQVKSEMKTVNNERVKTFTVLGFDIFHCGESSYKTGSRIGLPLNFSYKTSTDLDKKNIMVGNKTVHWTTPEGMLLESSLLLTDSAKKFAIARELEMASSHQVTIQSTINCSCSLLYYYLAYSFNRKGRTFERPRSIRFVLYALLGMFTTTLWLFASDFCNLQLEERADRQASDLGVDYTRGAVEFYTKTLQRNIALRSLLGDDGRSLYTTTGNDRVIFRTPHLPFTLRRDTALARYQKLTETGAGPTDSSQPVSA